MPASLWELLPQSYLVISEMKQSNNCSVARKHVKIHVSINTFHFWDLRSFRDWGTFLRFHVLVPMIIGIEARQLCWVPQVQPRLESTKSVVCCRDKFLRDWFFLLAVYAIKMNAEIVRVENGEGSPHGVSFRNLNLIFTKCCCYQ